MIDFTDGSHIGWRDNIHLTVCDTFVVFCRIIEGKDNKNNKNEGYNNNIYEILPHPHPTDLTDFRTLHEFQKEIENSKLDVETDLVYRGFVEARHTKDNKSFKNTLTIAQKVIRFGDKDKKMEFLKKMQMFRTPRLTSSSVSSATTTRGARSNPRRVKHQYREIRQTRSNQGTLGVPIPLGHTMSSPGIPKIDLPDDLAQTYQV